MSLVSFVSSAFGRTRRALPVSDHCDGERFFNPASEQARSIGDVITWQRTRERSAWPELVPLTPYPPPPAQVIPGAIAATFVGHSTFLLRTANAVILTDPVFTTHAGPFGRLGPRRVRAATPPLESLPVPDIVLVSHNHYDHLQPAPLRAGCRAAVHHAARARAVGAAADAAERDRAGLVGDSGPWRRTHRHLRAGAALLRAHAIRSQPDALVWLRAAQRNRDDLLR